MIEYNGEFPETDEEIRSLTGIGNYTAGAISAFAYGSGAGGGWKCITCKSTIFLVMKIS